MVDHTRAGDPADVDTHVEAVGLHHRRQRVDAAAREFPQIGQFLVGQAIQVGDLFVRHDQQMPAVVRIEVEQCETGAVAHDDQVCFVIIGLRDAGEQAGIKLWLRRQDVFDAPRRVQRFHAGRVVVGSLNVKSA